MTKIKPEQVEEISLDIDRWPWDAIVHKSGPMALALLQLADNFNALVKRLAELEKKI